jgi:hypothetical protein
MNDDPLLPARAIDGAHFSTVDEDGSVREWTRFRGAWVPLLVDADTFERIAAGEPIFEVSQPDWRWTL